MADAPSFKLKRIDELCMSLKWDMQSLLEKRMDLEFILELCALLVSKHEFNKLATYNLLRLCCNNDVFDKKQRLRLATRLAYFYDDLREGRSVGEWKSFIEGEWVAAEIIRVAPIKEGDKEQVLVYFLVRAGTAAGHVLHIQLSYGRCAYMAYLLGYTVRKQYDREDPRNLLFLQCLLKVGAGEALSIRETHVSSYQKTINSLIAKRRAGDCPLDLTINCAQCSRRYGEFAPQTNYCEGSINR